ncbi:MAG: hypothetical protein M3O26_19215 [Pseudomonadota bacterium]|nr:hypothetical protein [Pseudomonadota bacterium]
MNKLVSYMQRFQEEGFVVLPDVIDDAQCDALAHHLQALEQNGAGICTLLEESW